MGASFAQVLPDYRQLDDVHTTQIKAFKEIKVGVGGLKKSDQLRPVFFGGEEHTRWTAREKK